MVTTNHYDLDIDTTLGGNNASDYIIPSQKAIKSYVDNASGGSAPVWGNITGTLSNQTDLQDALDDKQDALVSGSNIKTINSTSILGSGNISVATSTQGALADTALQPNDNISELTNNAGYITSSALAPYALSADLSTVATSGSYNDLTNKPTIPTAQVNSDWNASSGVAQILNKPTLATVATSGSYNDLSNKPTIPTVNNATLTITQGGTTKGTFTANASSDVTIALDAGGSNVDIDNTTITENSSDQLQTVAVKDNRSGNAIKTWTGTRAQYDAITTKDSNTLYNITDDTDVTLSLLELLFPVGAVYFGTMSVCPLQTLGVGTWQALPQDKVIQIAGTRGSVGDTLEAGLPNITGGIASGGNYQGLRSGEPYGAFTQTSGSGGLAGEGNANARGFDFDASRSSSIYGNSNTVQPDAYLLNGWRRIS